MYGENAGFSTNHQVLFPVAPSGDGRGVRADVRTAEPVLPVLTPNLGVLPSHGGDGVGRMVPTTPYAHRRAKAVSSPKGEAMKLVMLVVFFLLWISTASTLLFLYMDRYLFPG